MKAEDILGAIKKVIDNDIATLAPKVASDEGCAFINGMLIEATLIKRAIKDFEELLDMYGERREI